jgi:hypothetical protein
MKLVNVKTSLGAWAVCALLVALVAVFTSGHGVSRASGPETIFWTSDALEPDTIASSWLLQRFAAPGCSVRLLPRGERSSVGTPFDLPLVELSRNRTHSTYHVIRESFGLVDGRLRALERLVDEIEISVWNSLPSAESVAFEAQIRARIAAAASPDEALESGFVLLDELYATTRPIEE